jgi:hypothetical protein
MFTYVDEKKERRESQHEFHFRNIRILKQKKLKNSKLKKRSEIVPVFGFRNPVLTRPSEVSASVPLRFCDEVVPSLDSRQHLYRSDFKREKSHQTKTFEKGKRKEREREIWMSVRKYERVLRRKE